MNPIEVEHLSYSVDGVTVLEDLNLTVGQGEFIGLIGPNGAGKTTLIQILLGAVSGWRGKVLVFGKPPKELGALRHLIGYCPQHNRFDPVFPARVIDVVLMGRTGVLGLFRPVGRADREQAMETLDSVGMADLAQRQIGLLSDGQQQRVFIARALVSRPELLILDEPTTAVDQAAQTSFMELLMELKRRFNLTILMVSHDIGLVSTHCSTVACLNRSLFCHGKPDVLDHDTLTRLFGKDVEILLHTDAPHRAVRRHDS